MSYPQPDSNSYAVGGYKFFRLNTLLSSPGDIYESEQSGHAFALGPESDIANVGVAYFDDEVPDFVNGTTIGPPRGFIGRLDARNSSKYAPSGRPGRIFLWSADLYDPDYRPAGFNGAHDSISFVTPRLDVIEYFTPIASLTPMRIDKEFLFQDFAVPPGGASYLVIPVYGRKSIFTEITNKSGAPVTYGITGVNFAITDNAVAPVLHQETVLHVAAPVANNAQVLEVFTADANGSFDVLVFSFQTGGGAIPFKVIASDTP